VVASGLSETEAEGRVAILPSGADEVRPTARIAALVGFMTVIALALMLLYRVYGHHTQADPEPDDESAIVELHPEAAATEKICCGLA
jgi:hypothetical protein